MMRTAALLLLLSTGAAAAADGIGGGADDVLTPARTAIGKQAWRDAIAALEPIVAREPDNADAWNLLGFGNRKLKNYDVAERAYSRALALDANHKGALEYLGELYVETGRRAAARPLLTRLETLCPLGCDELADLREALDGR
jgi:Flp pilus assembly protein TadD